MYLIQCFGKVLFENLVATKIISYNLSIITVKKDAAIFWINYCDRKCSAVLFKLLQIIVRISITSISAINSNNLA